MKQVNEKKLHLGKMTIQDLNSALDRDEQQKVMGGSATTNPGTTDVPIYC
ncbi:MAG: hypothetical protein NT166_31490 [Candidatus Aminicenantes bacterium]|nr:hypothetical protein [Candidatus Aminicenantes bacterium]